MVDMSKEWGNELMQLEAIALFQLFLVDERQLRCAMKNILCFVLFFTLAYKDSENEFFIFEI